MKAMVIDAFGAPEQMALRDIAQPQPQDGEVLIRIACAGVNPVDWKICEGIMARVFEHRFPLTPGWDASGVIVQAGAGVDRARIGQAVFAYCRQYGTPAEHGTYAEYIALPAAMAVPAPAGLSAAQAAAIPTAALTAWQGLLDAGQLRASQTVLILGGAGGVGCMAIQLARHAGAHVLATASAANHALVLGLGAHGVIDYRNEDLGLAVARLAPGGIDLVFDCVGGAYLRDALRLVRRGGRLVAIAGLPDAALAAQLGVHAERIIVSANPEQLQEMARLLAAGTFAAPPVEQLDWRDAALAHRRSKHGHVRGKLVLNVHAAPSVPDYPFQNPST